MMMVVMLMRTVLMRMLMLMLDLGRGLAEHLLLNPEDRWQMGQAAAPRYLRSSRRSRCYATPFVI